MLSLRFAALEKSHDNTVINFVIYLVMYSRFEIMFQQLCCFQYPYNWTCLICINTNCLLERQQVVQSICFFKYSVENYSVPNCRTTTGNSIKRTCKLRGNTLTGLSLMASRFFLGYTHFQSTLNQLSTDYDFLSRTT